MTVPPIEQPELASAEETNLESDAQILEFESENLTLRGYLFAPETPQTTAVVFCHGALEFQDNWFAYARQLRSEQITAFTFDFAGHGQSEGTRNLVDLRVWAYNIRDALNFLSTQGYRRFALVGWGLGGSAALLAAAHDTRLACAVVLSTPVSLMPPFSERVAYGLVSLAARVIKLFRKRPLTLSRLNELSDLRFLSEEQANDLFSTDARIQENYRAVPIPESLDSVWLDISRAVIKVEIPVLILHGVEDEIIPRDQSQKLANLLGGKKKIKTFDRSAHALHLDVDQAAVYDLTVKWIKQYLTK